MSQEQAVTGGARDIEPVTQRDVKIATWVCFFAWTFAVFDFVLFGNLLPRLASDHGWSESTATGINTWVTVGTALVAFAVGPMVDRLGRKRGMFIAVVGAALMSGATAIAGWLVGIIAGVGVVVLILVRSVAGLGYAEQSINAAYLNEIFSSAELSDAQKRRRGFTYSLVQSGWPVGSVLAAASIYLLYPIGGWALCFLVGVLPAFFMGWAIRYLRESPHFAARKLINEALRNGDHTAASAIAATVGIPIEEASSSEEKPLRAAFTGESLRTSIVLPLSFLLVWLGVLVFVILGSTILSSPDGKNLDFSGALEILIISNATAFIGYLFHGWLGDRIGRRNTIAIAWVVAAALFTAMLATPNDQAALILVFYSAGSFFLVGSFSAMLFFGSESYPVHTRATGGSLISAAGQIGAVIGGALITASLSSGGTWAESAFLYGCVPIFVGGILILFARNTSSQAYTI